MILVDANILLYAEDLISPQHQKANIWWDKQLSGTEPVCLCWTVISAFIRIATNQRVFEYPLDIQEAVKRVDSWLEQPCTRIIRPTEYHWTTFKQLIIENQANANLVTDAHLAALALEHSCTLASTDSDFSRFPRLRWINPLV